MKTRLRHLGWRVYYLLRGKLPYAAFPREVEARCAIDGEDLASLVEEVLTNKLVLDRSSNLRGLYTVDTLGNRFVIPFSAKDTASRDINRSILHQGNNFDAPADLAAWVEEYHGEVMLDVGANIGVVSVSMSRNFKTIYSFEPVASNWAILEANLLLNSIGNVEVVKKAVSSGHNTLVPIYLYPSNGHHSLGDFGEQMRPVGRQDVQTVSLDSFCLERGVDEIEFMKVDVEGYELDVLKGAHCLLADHRIKNVAFEVSRRVLCGLSKKASDIMLELVKHGYGVFDMEGNRIEDPRSLDAVNFGNFLSRPL